jgi:23S rRNA pseudouridine2605 synthase
MAVDRVRLLEADNNAWVEVTLHEGKHHEVKRMLEAVGYPVSKLRRVSFGPVTTKGLEPGQFRTLTPEEVQGLLRAEGAPVAAARTRRARRQQRPQPASKPRRSSGKPPAGGTSRPPFRRDDERGTGERRQGERREGPRTEGPRREGPRPPGPRREGQRREGPRPPSRIDRPRRGPGRGGRS